MRISLLLSAAAFLAASPFVVVASTDNPQENRQRLLSRLDSLEIVKQELKRSGASIDELDVECAALRDSLVLLRKALEYVAPANEPRVQEAEKQSAISKIKARAPRDFFDWVVTGACGVAILSGLLLVVGLFRSRGTGKRASRRVPGSTANQGEPNDEKITGARDEDAGIEKLRSRIARSEGTLSTVPLQPSAPAHHQAPAADTDSQTVRLRIIEAARQGLTVAEISKQLQVSADHVSLILAVARKDLRPGKN